MSLSPPPLVELAAYTAKLPALPEVVHHLMHSLNDESADVDTLAHHINSDPVIVARLLAAANSVSSGLTTRIYSAKQAFIVLGANRVSQIVLAAALSHRFDHQGSGFETRLLWRHSLGVATCAQVLAEEIGLNTDLAFTGGLLHDIGQLLIFTAAPSAYMQVLERHASSDIPLVAAEKEIFAYDHTEAGAMLAEAWKLPHEITEAIVAHHAPDEIGSDIGNLVHVSEILSHALDLGELPNNHVAELSDLACASLGLSWAKLAPRFAEIEARYDGFRVALGI